MSKSAQIVTLNVREAFQLIDSGEIEASQVYLVTLSEKLKSEFENRGTSYLKSLAPTSSLWTSVQGLKQAGVWDYETFLSFYRPTSLTSLLDRNSSISVLEMLASKIRQGEKVYLVCFCENPQMCHRTILAEVLMNMTAKNVMNG